MTANLQKKPTVKQIAAAFNVSERMIYMAGKLCRLRPDLASAVERGELSLHKALNIAEGKPPKAPRPRCCPHCGAAI